MFQFVGGRMVDRMKVDRTGHTILSGTDPEHERRLAFYAEVVRTMMKAKGRRRDILLATNPDVNPLKRRRVGADGAEDNDDSDDSGTFAGVSEGENDDSGDDDDSQNSSDYLFEPVIRYNARMSTGPIASLYEEVKQSILHNPYGSIKAAVLGFGPNSILELGDYSIMYCAFPVEKHRFKMEVYVWRKHDEGVDKEEIAVIQRQLTKPVEENDHEPILSRILEGIVRFGKHWGPEWDGRYEYDEQHIRTRKTNVRS